MTIPSFTGRAILFAVVAGIAALVITAGASTAAAGCSARFDAHVLHGPDASLALSGPLDLTIAADHTVSGTLSDTTLGAVDVGGRLTGLALHLTLHLGDGRTLRGQGALDGVDFAACSGTATGSLQGPRNGDTGNWGIIWGS